MKYENEFKWGKSNCIKHFLTEESLLSCLDISDAKHCLQGQFSLKSHIFLVMTFSILGVFNFLEGYGLVFNVFICGNQFQFLAVSLKINYFGIVIMLP